jgi:hypothetical protein
VVAGSRTGSTTSYQQGNFEVRLHPQESNDHYVISTGGYESAKADARLLSEHFGVVLENFTARQ